mgnify:CR=1 FL=1
MAPWAVRHRAWDIIVIGLIFCIFDLWGTIRLTGPEQVEQFYVACPQFERMLVQDGILLLKYWFSIKDDEQEKRFQARIDCEERRWKISPMDIESRNRWVEYSRAKDIMFSKTHIPEAPWFTVEALSLIHI